jgi:hypothetical protein
MKNAIMACAALTSTLGLTMSLSGCRSDGGGNAFAARDTTVEYYRVFDIRTDAAPPAVARAASDGIARNVKDAVVATSPGVAATDLPGHFRMADPAGTDAFGTTAGITAGTAAARGPTCEGASWTAKASPRVRGGDNLNLVACLFPYKSGYHLDMYAVFTKPEGGWLAWPRRLTGTLVGTPEKFTETAMLDVVRTIRANTNAQVALVEAKPNLPGTPWLEGDTPVASTAPATGTPAASKP